MKKCAYCGRIADDLIRMGEDGEKHKTSFICSPNTGCQTKYEHTWTGYFGAMTVYDIPFLLLGILAIYVAKNAVEPAFLPNITTSANIITVSNFMFWFYMVISLILPILTMIFVHIPIIVSPIILAILSYLLAYKVI